MRIVGTIAIDGTNYFRLSTTKSRHDGRRHAQIPGLAKQPAIGLGSEQAFQRLPGVVRALIVHQDQMDLVILCQGLPDAAQSVAQV